MQPVASHMIADRVQQSALPTTSSVRRRPQIDGLRAVAIFSVLFDHFWMAENAGLLGTQGVHLFLIISGYLITGILLDCRGTLEQEQSSFWGTMRAFYARRALRIFPAFYATLAVTWLFGSSDWQGSELWHFLFGSSVLFAINDAWGPPWQLAHLWSISVQEQFYLLWPPLVLLLPSRKLPIAVISLALAGLMFRLVVCLMGEFDSVGSYTLLPASLPALCLGSWLALKIRSSELPELLQQPGPVLPTAMVLLFAAYSVMPIPGWLRYALLDPLWLLGLAAMLATASRGMGGLTGRFLEQSWLRYLGRMGLGIYLYHLISADLAWKIMRRTGFPTERGPVLFVIATSITLLAAILSWELLERPVNAMKRFFPYRTRQDEASRRCASDARR